VRPLPVAPAAVAAAALGLALLPAARPPAFYESFLYLVFHWIALATSWSILSGFSGYFSFGHGAFFGAGMYATATLLTAGLPFLPALPLAGLATALFGVGMGAVVFRVRRLRGELFALLTLAVTFVLATIVLNTRIDGGPGVYLSAIPLPRLAGSAAATLYLLALAVALATVATAYAVYHARWGAGLFAIHDDEDVAEVLGVPTYRYKLLALGLSAGLAGVAGGVHAMFVTYVTVAETFSIVVPLYVVLMSVLGGARHWLGPAIGATLVTVLMYGVSGGQTAVAGRAAVGLTLMLAILFLPEGITGFVGRRRRSPRPSASVSPAPAAGTSSIARPASRLAEPPVLVCDDVRKAFRGVQALRGVSLEVREGEILGLVGPNGSGKSTLINVVSGHHRADGGRIVVGGVDVTGHRAYQIAQRGLSRTYQIPRPFSHLTVRENVAVAGMFGRLRRGRRAAEREAERWLEFTGLADRADMLPASLNLHQRKFLELARALASEPRLVLLDEVLSGLAPAEMADATRLVRDIRDRGATVVFVEHIMRAVVALADRVVVLDAGQVLAGGAPQDVMRHPDVVRRYLGKAHA
jgi:branched-chain amino acid transport system permease protein